MRFKVTLTTALLGCFIVVAQPCKDIMIDSSIKIISPASAPPTSVPPLNAKHRHLRQSLRRRRRNLGIGRQIAAARRLAETIGRQAIYCDSRHIACYLPNDGELSLWPVLKQSWLRKKHCYLPVIDGRQLRFVHFSPGAPLVKNRFGILEPATGRCLHLCRIDLVLVPLVAFDHCGNRLGMGGGFYDRTFAGQLSADDCGIAGRSVMRRPVLCGIGHRCQQVAQLTPQPWDLPMDMIAIA